VYSTLVPAVGFEWHRYDAEALQQQDKVSKVAPEFLIDLALGDVACTTNHDDNKPCLRIRPFIATKYAIARNFIADEWDGTFSSLVSPFSIHPGLPGAWFPAGDPDKRLIRYTPSTGFERFANPVITGDNDAVVAPAFNAWTYTALIDAEIYPFNLLRKNPTTLQRVSLTFLGAFRKTLSGDIPDSTLNGFEAAAIYYLDDASRFGLSLTHQRGRLPKNNFIDLRRTVLALTIQLSGN
jgi:hypothetical protein